MGHPLYHVAPNQDALVTGTRRRSKVAIAPWACAVVLLMIVAGINWGVASAAGGRSTPSPPRSTTSVVPPAQELRQGNFVPSFQPLGGTTLGASPDISPSTNEITGLNDPSGMAYDSQNGYLYVVTSEGQNVTVISTATDQIVQNISIPGSVPGSNLFSIAFDATNGDIYLGDLGPYDDYPAVPGTNVTVIDGATNTVVGTVVTGLGPTGISIDSQSGDVYVGDAGNVTDRGNISVISGTTNLLMGNVSLGYTCDNPTSSAFDSLNGFDYVVGGSPYHGSEDICWINATTNVLAGELNTGAPMGEYPQIAFDPATGDVYAVTSPRLNGENVELYVINGSSNSLLASITLPFGTPVGGGSVNPGIGYDAQTQDVLVTIPDYGGSYPPDVNTKVLVFNGTTEVSTFAAQLSCPCVGPDPIYDPENHEVYITNQYGTSMRGGSVTIVPPEQFTFHATLAVSDATPLLGQTVAFVTNATGGVAPYNYTYLGFPPGCVSEDKPAVGCLPTQADFYNVTVYVRDQNNVTVNSTASIHVIFDFNVVVPTNASAGSPFTISVNTNESFSGGTAVVPASGFGSFTYNYTGLPPGCASKDLPSITCTTSQVGTYHITVNVHDQVGDHNTHTVVVNVVPAKSTPGFLGLSGDTGYLIIGGVVAIAGVAAALLLVRSRRAQRKSSEPASPAHDPSAAEKP
jgi:DNA-binding beta-propeller fold protein YncE